MTDRGWQKCRKHSLPRPFSHTKHPLSIVILSLFALPGLCSNVEAVSLLEYPSPPRHGPARQVKGGAEGAPENQSMIMTVMI